MGWCLIYVIFLALLMIKAQNYSNRQRKSIQETMEAVEAILAGKNNPEGEVILRTRGIYTRIGRK